MQASKSLILVCVLLSACSSIKTTNPETKAVEKQKRVASINMQLGMAYLADKNMQRAKEKFLFALNEAPNLPETHYSLAYYYEMTGDTDQAKQQYLEAIALAPTRGDTLNNYGTFLCRNHNYQEALTHFDLALKDPNYLNTAEANENAGICASKIPDEKLAMNYFKKALMQDTNRPTALYQLARLYYKNGELKASQEALNKYYSMAPVSSETQSLQNKIDKKIYG